MPEKIAHIPSAPQQRQSLMALYMQLPHEMDAYLLQITSRSPDIRWHSIPKFQQINRNHAWICGFVFSAEGQERGLEGLTSIHCKGPLFWTYSVTCSQSSWTSWGVQRVKWRFFFCAWMFLGMFLKEWFFVPSTLNYWHNSKMCLGL